MKPSLLLSGVLLVGLSAPIWAQPQPNPRAVQNHWRELRRTWRNSELKDPQSAIDAYEKFYVSLTDANGDVAVEVVSRVAQLYGHELGQRERALQIYAEAMKRWRAPENLERLRRESQLMSGQGLNEATAVIPVEELAPANFAVATEVQAKAGTLVALLVAGQSADAVWHKAEWEVADVVWALQNIITDDGILRGQPRKGKRVCEALAELLAKHGGDLVSGENWRNLPPKTRLWLGDYYRREKDDKALTVLASVLDEAERRGKNSGVKNEALLFFSAERLSWFYRDKFEYNQAAQTWLRVPPLLAETDWRVPDALIGAARSYKKAGEIHNALMLYHQVPSYGHGRFTGLAYLDQALLLTSQNKHEEARLLLQKPVEGEQADRAKVVMSLALARSYQETGDEQNARKYAEQVIARHQALQNYKWEDAIEWAVTHAKEILNGKSS